LMEVLKRLRVWLYSPPKLDLPMRTAKLLGRLF
jgi:hypothetical protein